MINGNRSPLSRIVADINKGNRPSLEAVRAEITGEQVLEKSRKSPVWRIALLAGILLGVRYFLRRK